MNSALIAMLAAVAGILFLGSLALLAHDLLFRYRLLLRERVAELSGKPKSDANASVFKDLKQFDADLSASRTHWRARLQNVLDQADIRAPIGTLVGASLLMGALIAALLVLLSRAWWTAPLGLLAGMLIPAAYVRLKCRLRVHRLSHQLPEAFDAIGRAVKAGQTVPAAMQIVGDDFERPIRDEFRRCYEEQNLGMPHETALRNLAARTGVMELRIFVVALLVQSRSGGDLVELLSNLSSMVRKRIKLQQRVKALTGEGRMQAAVLIGLPFVAFFGIWIVAPDYAAILLKHPSLLLASAAAQFVGAIWIRRIVSFEF